MLDLQALPAREARFIEPMDCLAVTQLPEGAGWAIRRVIERVGQENFRTRILTVYDFCCAVYGVQSELVEAAHIIPVPAGGTNRTSNGVALCSFITGRSTVP